MGRKNTTYVITASNPDGSQYQDAVDRAIGSTSGVAAYGDTDRDNRVQAIRDAGLTPHVRQA